MKVTVDTTSMCLSWDQIDPEWVEVFKAKIHNLTSKSCSIGVSQGFHNYAFSSKKDNWCYKSVGLKWILGEESKYGEPY